MHGLIDHYRQEWLKWDASRGTVTAPEPTFLPIPTDATEVAAAIGAPGEIDRFQFTITDPGQYQMRTHGATDVVMYLAGPDNPGRLIAVNDDGAGDRNALLSGTLPAATYFVYITHYAPAGTGAYGISVTPLS